MLNSIKHLFTPLALVAFFGVLLGACSPSPTAMVEKMEERIARKLELNEVQEQKLNNLAEVMKPAVTDALQTMRASREEWRNIIDNSVDNDQDLSPTAMTSLVDNVIDVYQQNKTEVSSAMADFYNSLNQDQKRKVAKMMKRGRGFLGHRGKHHGHKKHRDHSHDGDHQEYGENHS